MEMDIEHLATQSNNQVTATAPTYDSTPVASVPAFLQTMGSAAFFDGRPTLHDDQDLEESSPVRTQHKGDFDLASGVVVKLRDHLLGKDWKPGAQKYAFAAAALEALPHQSASASVQAVIDRQQAIKGNGDRNTCLLGLLSSSK